MKLMLHCAATARWLWELQANAKVESASKKINPPCAIRWPLTMCGCTVIASVAWPGLISTISMPRPLLASSSCHIASAQARARSSGESMALTFTAISPCRRACWNKPLELCVQWVSHDAKPPWCQRSLRASNRVRNRQEIGNIHDVSPQKTRRAACYRRGALRASACEGRRSGFARTNYRAAYAVAGRERGSDRSQGGGGESVRRQSRHRPDVLRGISAHARPRLC